jgi:hypothetical protein
MPESHPPKSWRRRFRFSLRALLIVVLVIGAGLGWTIHRVKVQRDAVSAIQRARGSTLYDWEWMNNGPVLNGKPWAPKWLVDWLGVDWFGHVIFVQLYPDHGPGDVDEVFSHISRLDRLEELNLFGPSVTDARLACLDGLTSLQQLKLHGTRVDGPGLEHLKRLAKLRVLRLEETPVNDDGLLHLKALSGLKELWLYRTKVTEAGANALQKALPVLAISR